MEVNVVKNKKGITQNEKNIELNEKNTSQYEIENKHANLFENLFIHYFNYTLLLFHQCQSNNRIHLYIHIYRNCQEALCRIDLP